jgi:hypothetical protein
MIRLYSLTRISVAVSAVALLAACAQTTPPPAPMTEPMRGAALPPPDRLPASGGTPAIATEQMRGGPLPAPGNAVVRRGGAAPQIGTEPMRGGPLDNTGPDQAVGGQTRAQ